jgi:hypothetical protein
VTHNTAGVSGGGIYNDARAVTLTKSKVKHNSPDDYVGLPLQALSRAGARPPCPSGTVLSGALALP